MIYFLVLLSPRPHYENPGQEEVKTESEGFVSERCLCKARPYPNNPLKKPNKQTNKKNPLHFFPTYLFVFQLIWLKVRRSHAMQRHLSSFHLFTVHVASPHKMIT